jgi:hypothetical protein
MEVEKKYIGCKVIKAIMQKKDGEVGYKVTYSDGYVSWSPKDVFENAYREITLEEVELIIS